VKRRIAAAAALGLLAGCTERLDPPTASVGSVVSLRAFPLAPVSVAPFGVEGAAAANDRRVAVRAGRFTPPKGTGWADYLRSTLVAQLNATGRHDPASSVRIAGTLVENRSGENFSDGKAVLAARFIVTSGDTARYDKVQRVEIDWRSNFIGMLAYDAALRHYTAMYPMLIEKLIADPDFRAAVAAS
jgi:hypothetical protein